jgi:hypothetical protein
MAIRRQNRTIWGLVLVTFIMIVSFLVRDGRLADFFDPSSKAKSQANAASNSSASTEEQFGDKVSNENPVVTEDQAKFNQMMGRLVQCLGIQSIDLKNSWPLQIESVIQIVQPSLGPATHQADHWMDWHLRTREGKERRLHLEITESDLGKIGRELHYFSVDRSGQLTSVELEPEKATNPSDEVINQMLKEGEVFHKERAAAAFFANQERIEYIEKDSELSEISFFKDSHHFQCANVKMPENCQCL